MQIIDKLKLVKYFKLRLFFWNKLVMLVNLNSIQFTVSFSWSTVYDEFVPFASLLMRPRLYDQVHVHKMENYIAFTYKTLWEYRILKLSGENYKANALTTHNKQLSCIPQHGNTIKFIVWVICVWCIDIECVIQFINITFSVSILFD